MLHVSVLIEALRARPALLVVFATLAQALVWTIVPTLFFASPPPGLLEVLAVGREHELGSAFGPPLAFWLADIAFNLGGLFGVYLLSQICVTATVLTVFVLARGIVGTRHAAIAVILMVGLLPFSLPTPDFGPAVLAMPITALALLHYWRAVAHDRRTYWFVLALDIGLLLLTTYSGVILLFLLIVFTVLTERGRASLRSIDPWAALLVMPFVLFPHLVWLDQNRAVPLRATFGVSSQAVDDRLLLAAEFAAALLVALLGVAIFVAVAGGFGIKRDARAPVFERPPVDPFNRVFVYVFAVMPAITLVVIGLVIGRPARLGALGPHLVLATLAIVVAAGDAIRLYRQQSLGLVWLGLLAAPVLGLLAALVLFPFVLAADLKLGDPTAAMGRFFADSFQRRTGKPLPIVVGDARLAELIAVGSPDRPSVLFAASPELSPWATAADAKERGAVVVWPIVDPSGAPPPAIRKLFPDLVPEVPQAFSRPIDGRLDSLRIGWAVIRPQAKPAQ